MPERAVGSLFHVCALPALPCSAQLYTHRLSATLARSASSSFLSCCIVLRWEAMIGGRIVTRGLCCDCIQFWHDDAQSDVSCQPVDRAHSVSLAWEDRCFLRRSAGHPPRTCCASCRHVLQQPKFSSFAVMCLLRTRDQHAALRFAISWNKKTASKDHGFSSFRSGWLCNRCDVIPHIDASIVQRCGTGIFGDDDEGRELCARDSLAFMDSAHASSFGRRAVFQPQSRDLGMAASPFRGYKASHPKAWRGGVSLFSLFLGLSVWPKWPPVGLERHWQTPCIMVSGVSTPST